MSNYRHEVALLENAEPWRGAYSITYSVTLFSKCAAFPHVDIPHLGSGRIFLSLLFHTVLAMKFGQF